MAADHEARIAAEKREQERIARFLACECGCWAWLTEQLTQWEAHYISKLGPDLTPEARAWTTGMLQFAHELRTRPEHRLRVAAMVAQHLRPPDAGVPQRPPRASTGMTR